MKNKMNDAERIAQIVLSIGSLSDVKSLLRLNLDIDWIKKNSGEEVDLLYLLFYHVKPTQLTEKQEHIKTAWSVARKSGLAPNKKNNDGITLLEEKMFYADKRNYNEVNVNINLIKHWLENKEINEKDITDILFKKENKHLFLSHRDALLNLLKTLNSWKDIEDYYNKNKWLGINNAEAMEKEKTSWSKEDVGEWIRHIKLAREKNPALKKMNIAALPLILKLDNGNVGVDEDIEDTQYLMTDKNDYLKISDLLSRKGYEHVTSHHIMKTFSLLSDPHKDSLLNYFYSRGKKSKEVNPKLYEGVYLYYKDVFKKETNASNLIKLSMANLSLTKKSKYKSAFKAESLIDNSEKNKISPPWYGGNEWGGLHTRKSKAHHINAIFHLFFDGMTEEVFEKEFNLINSFLANTYNSISTTYEDGTSKADSFINKVVDNLFKMKAKDNKSNQYVTGTIWHCILLVSNHGQCRERMQRKVLFLNKNKQDERFNIFDGMTYHPDIEKSFQRYKKTSNSTEANDFERIIYKQYMTLNNVQSTKKSKRKIM